MLRHGSVRSRHGSDVAFAVFGPRATSRPPVMLVHPINMRKECWFGLTADLASDRQCVLVDLPGHGESSDPAVFSLDHWVDDCADVASEFDLGQGFHVVGGSLGGAVAVGLAGVLPTAVRSICAMGTSVEVSATEPGGTNPVELLDTSSTAELFSILAVEAVAPDSPTEVIETVRRLTNSHGPDVVRRVLVAARSADPSEWMHDVACPSLVINGEHDTTSSPAGGRRMADMLRGSHVTLGGVGHLPMIEAPREVLNVLQPHLENAD